jgi:c-di-GMP-binding flagellar brake protein YcgR
MNNMEDQNAENKRKSARGCVSIKVSYRKAEGLLASASRIKDISETGLCIPLDLNLPVNSLVELNIPFEDYNTSIKTMARVVRITPRKENSGHRFDVGLEFFDLAAHQRNLIRRYIELSKQ